MRLTVIGHSCLYFETSGPTVLVDPWISGSAYWRSWWLFPPSAPANDQWLQAQHVYLTHHHFDHFHFPTLRRVNRGAQMLLPKFGVPIMGNEVRNLGFTHVRELEHAEIATIAPGVRVASYQYGFDDTAFVIADGDTVVVDLNDCKMRGQSLAQIVHDFGRVTFMFKSYSWAQAYPNCYESDDPADLQLISRETYARDFIEMARILRPKYAVPFGSMVALLHPETRALNKFSVLPDEIAQAFAASGVEGTEFVVMAPGDSWSTDGGFVRSDFDWYTEREKHLDALAASVQDKIAATAAEEARRTLSFDAFASYFKGFMQALPTGTAAMTLRRPIVFEIPGDAQPYWILDFSSGTVRRAAEVPPDAASVARIAPGLLADAIEKKIVNFIHISMRMHVKLRPGGVNADLAFWGLLAIFELGYLPLRNVMTRRFAEVAWRRRREGYDIVGAITGGEGPLLKRLSRGFATPPAKE